MIFLPLHTPHELIKVGVRKFFEQVNGSKREVVQPIPNRCLKGDGEGHAQQGLDCAIQPHGHLKVLQVVVWVITTTTINWT